MWHAYEYREIHKNQFAICQTQHIFLMNTDSCMFRPKHAAVFIYKVYMLCLTDFKLIFIFVSEIQGGEHLKKNP